LNVTKSKTLDLLINLPIQPVKANSSQPLWQSLDQIKGLGTTGKSFNVKSLPKDHGNTIKTFKAEEIKPTLEATHEINNALRR
jgi:hypothetical protein